MSHSRRKYTEVPIKIDGTLKYVKGVSKYTTCGDVIKMILKKTDEGKENGTSDAFGIYESSRGIERLLPAKSRLLKVTRSWGMDTKYEFVFRKVNTAFVAPKISEAKRRKLTNRQRSTQKYEKVAKLASIVHSQKTKLNKHESDNEFVKEIYFNDSDSSMDEFISHVDKNNMKGFLNFCGAVSAEEINRLSASQLEMGRNVTGRSDDFGLVQGKDASSVSNNVNDVKYAVRKTLKTKTCTVSDLSSKNSTNKPGTEIHATPNLKAAKEHCRTVKRHDKLAHDIATKVARMNQKEGKEALLRKYFADYITYRSPGYKFRDSRFREQGDGAEATTDCLTQRQVDGCDFTTATPKRRPSQTSLTFNVSETSSDSGQEDDLANFDTAFMEEGQRNNVGYVEPHVSFNSETSNSDNLLDHSEYDFNTAYMGKLVDYSLSEEDSALTEPSDISSISSIGENIIHNVTSVSDIVKAVFNENIKELSEDDEMESFMKTKLWDDFSDEGLSSLDSDDEREILV